MQLTTFLSKNRLSLDTLDIMIPFVECPKTRPFIHAGLRAVQQAKHSTKR